MKAVAGLLLLVFAANLGASDLPRVSHGAGINKSAGSNAPDSASRHLQRRLDAEPPPRTTHPMRIPEPATLYPVPGGAVTDTGTPIRGQDVLRDRDGGVWNCTDTGCFAPDGRFVPMRRFGAGTSTEP